MAVMHNVPGGPGSGSPVRGPEAPPPITEQDTTFSRYPELWELVRDGGLPGVWYGLIPAEELNNVRREGWSQIQDVPALTIEGPRGLCPTVLLVGKGEPALGGAAGNGKRKYSVHYRLEEITGLWADPSQHLENSARITPADIQAASNQRPKAAREGAGGAPAAPMKEASHA